MKAGDRKIVETQDFASLRSSTVGDEGIMLSKNESLTIFY